MRTLPIYPKHAPHTRVLPAHHPDPFDRILVSQAVLEEMSLLRAHLLIPRYHVEVVW